MIKYVLIGVTVIILLLTAMNQRGYCYPSGTPEEIIDGLFARWEGNPNVWYTYDDGTDGNSQDGIILRSPNYNDIYNNPIERFSFSHDFGSNAIVYICHNIVIDGKLYDADGASGTSIIPGNPEEDEYNQDELDGDTGGAGTSGGCIIIKAKEVYFTPCEQFDYQCGIHSCGGNGGKGGDGGGWASDDHYQRGSAGDGGMGGSGGGLTIEADKVVFQVVEDNNLMCQWRTPQIVLNGGHGGNAGSPRTIENIDGHACFNPVLRNGAVGGDGGSGGSVILKSPLVYMTYQPTSTYFSVPGCPVGAGIVTQYYGYSGNSCDLKPGTNKISYIELPITANGGSGGSGSEGGPGFDDLSILGVAIEIPPQKPWDLFCDLVGTGGNGGKGGNGGNGGVIRSCSIYPLLFHAAGGAGGSGGPGGYSADNRGNHEYHSRHGAGGQGGNGGYHPNTEKCYNGFSYSFSLSAGGSGGQGGSGDDLPNCSALSGASGVSWNNIYTPNLTYPPDACGVIINEMKNGYNICYTSQPYLGSIALGDNLKQPYEDEVLEVYLKKGTTFSRQIYIEGVQHYLCNDEIRFWINKDSLGNIIGMPSQGIYDIFVTNSECEYTFKNAINVLSNSDECAGAIEVFCGDILTGNLTYNSTPSGKNTCNPTVKDVWYKITVPDMGTGLNVYYIPNGGTNSFVALYTGSNCNNLGQIACDNDQPWGQYYVYYETNGNNQTFLINIGSDSDAPNQVLIISCFDKMNGK